METPEQKEPALRIKEVCEEVISLGSDLNTLGFRLKDLAWRIKEISSELEGQSYFEDQAQSLNGNRIYFRRQGKIK